MGECAYYLKAEYPTKKEAQKASEKLDEFFSEAREAYDYYQPGRETEPKKFWAKFSKDFPLTWDYVQTIPGFKKTSADPNDLSGKLDFGQDENGGTLVQGNIVGWGDCSVWHFADWTPLCNYIEKKFGAIRVVWGTEENGVGSLEALQLYDWEMIVVNILEHKELYPMLIGINKELDFILDRKGKEVTHAKRKTLERSKTSST
jgi:hypothetical protein